MLARNCKWILGISFFLLLIAGCKEEEDLYGVFRIDVVTCISEDGSVKFRRDDGVFLIPEPAFYRDSYPTGQRALLHYILLQVADESGNSNAERIKVEIKGVSPVTTQPVLFYTPEQLLSVPDDEIYLESVWLSGGYINIRFQIEVNRPDIKHRLSVICDKSLMNRDDTVRLELRHDKNSDIPGYLTAGYGSFRVDTFDVAGTKAFRIKINASNYPNKTEFLLPVAKAED